MLHTHVFEMLSKKIFNVIMEKVNFQLFKEIKQLNKS